MERHTGGKKMKYYIQYEVEGFPKTQTAGPYEENEVEYQLADIAGYEGVRDARLVPEYFLSAKVEPK